MAAPIWRSGIDQEIGETVGTRRLSHPPDGMYAVLKTRKWACSSFHSSTRRTAQAEDMFLFTNNPSDQPLQSVGNEYVSPVFSY